MEWLVLSLFSLSLLVCISLDISILYALGLGLFLLLLYGKKKGFSWRELIEMTCNGIKTVRNIIITFFLIGILAAFWRASGTIAVIVCYASKLIKPSVFLLMTFLLNSGISFLTGTSFGTAATMGVICATMGNSMGVSPMLMGGAVLSGVYFGDRCSPVSTSALLVAALTKTDIYRNIQQMARSALLPFALTCLAYLALGLHAPEEGAVIELEKIFSKEFMLHWLALIPAAIILMLSLGKVNVKLSMTASILSAVPLCLFLQRISPESLLRAAVFGYSPQDAEVAAMVSGGGILSMGKVAGIVCLSSSYSDLFQKTGLLNGAKRIIASLAQKTTSFTATLVTSLLAGMIACNQTLTILLTHQLCVDLNRDNEKFALALEDSAVVVAPLIPWSIAGAVPLYAIGAPMTSILVSFYLFFLPLGREIASWRRPK